MARIKEEQKPEDEEEEKRIFYVAATRAEEHLVLSGATDLEKLRAREPWRSPCAGSGAAWRRAWTSSTPEGRPAASYDGRDVRVACRVLRPADVDELLPAADREPVAPDPEPPGLDALAAPALAAVPVPEALAVSRLSYSGLTATSAADTASTSSARCGCRRPATGPRGRPRRRAPRTPCPALVRGSMVHLLLEELDFAARRRRSAEVGPDRVRGAPARAEDVADLTGMVDGFAASALLAASPRPRGCAPSCRSPTPWTPAAAACW